MSERNGHADGAAGEEDERNDRSVFFVVAAIVCGFVLGIGFLFSIVLFGL